MFARADVVRPATRYLHFYKILILFIQNDGKNRGPEKSCPRPRTVNRYVVVLLLLFCTRRPEKSPASAKKRDMP